MINEELTKRKALSKDFIFSFKVCSERKVLSSLKRETQTVLLGNKSRTETQKMPCVCVRETVREKLRN